MVLLNVLQYVKVHRKARVWTIGVTTGSFYAERESLGELQMVASIVIRTICHLEC